MRLIFTLFSYLHYIFFIKSRYNITIPQRKNNIDGIDKVYCLPLKGRPKIPSFKALIYIFFIIAERCFPPLTVSGKTAPSVMLTQTVRFFNHIWPEYNSYEAPDSAISDCRGQALIRYPTETPEYCFHDKALRTFH